MSNRWKVLNQDAWYSMCPECETLWIIGGSERVMCCPSCGEVLKLFNEIHTMLLDDADTYI